MAKLAVTCLALILLATAGLACGAVEDPDQATDARLFVAYVDAAGQAHVRAEPGDHEWRIDLDGEVLGLSWSPTADRLVVTERDGDDWAYVILETDDFTSPVRVPLTERPGGTITWRAGGAAFVASGLDRHTAFSRTGRELWSVPGGGAPVGWSPDGQWFAIADGPVLQAHLMVTNGSITHWLGENELVAGVVGLLRPTALIWLADGTIVFSDATSADIRGWRVEVSDSGIRLAAPADPWAAMDAYLALHGRSPAGQAARNALVAEVGADPEAPFHAGLHWTSVRTDVAGGHVRNFARRNGPTLGSERIVVVFDDRFPQVAAVGLPPQGS